MSDYIKLLIGFNVILVVWATLMVVSYLGVGYLKIKEDWGIMLLIYGIAIVLAFISWGIGSWMMYVNG